MTLRQGSKTVWEKNNVTTPSFAYPDDEPPLAPGKDYKLIVIDNDHQVSSETDEPAGTGFGLATEADRATINEGLAPLKSLGDLSEPELNFVLGVYYASLPPSPQGFSPLGEAWLIFKELAPSQSAPVIQLWYGDILNGLKLLDEAEGIYQTALAHAERSDDLESQGLANVRLWCTTTKEEFFDQAIQLFEQLGDETRVKILQEGKNLLEACKAF